MLNDIANGAARILAPILLVTIAYLAVRTCATTLQPPPVSFAPLALHGIKVEPERLRVGETVTFTDGLCNRTDLPVTAQLYLGAQTADQSTFNTVVVDLLTRNGPNNVREPVRDTPEGRLTQVIEPGCIATEPIQTRLPAGLTPGKWIVRAHVIVIGDNGERQDIAATSNVFEVLP